MPLESHQRRRFWQDTFRHAGCCVVVEYVLGNLVPVVYLEGGRRYYFPGVPAVLFTGGDALDQREWEMGLITAALGAAANNAPHAQATDPAFEKAHPTLFAFMTQLQEEGKERTPSSLVVFAEDGQWKVCLTERDANLQLWRTGETFQKALAALEKALAGGGADWRRKFDPAKRKGAGKGK